MATAQSASKDEGVAAMTKASPDYQLPMILDFGMQAIHPVPRLHRRVTNGSASAVPAQRW